MQFQDHRFAFRFSRSFSLAFLEFVLAITFYLSYFRLLLLLRLVGGCHFRSFILLFECLACTRKAPSYNNTLTKWEAVGTIITTPRGLSHSSS